MRKKKFLIWVGSAMVGAGLGYLATPAIGPAAGRLTSFWRCPMLRFNDQNPFGFEAEVAGSKSRWVLRVNGDHLYPKYLLIRELKPAFVGLDAKMIIKTTDQPLYASPWFSAGLPPLTVSSQSSYAMLSPETQSTKRYEVAYPIVDSHVTISQTRGTHARATHTEENGQINAVDFAATIGATVVAAQGGIVVFVEHRSPDGGCTHPDERARPDNQIVILHDDGTEGVYSHLKQNSPRVAVGQRVNRGDVIASVGTSGWTPGPHLHFHGGGLTSVGYRTLPLEFTCRDGRRILPVKGGEVCSLFSRL